jgi:hypothetical protein
MSIYLWSPISECLTALSVSSWPHSFFPRFFLYLLVLYTYIQLYAYNPTLGQLLKLPCSIYVNCHTNKSIHFIHTCIHIYVSRSQSRMEYRSIAMEVECRMGQPSVFLGFSGGLCWLLVCLSALFNDMHCQIIVEKYLLYYLGFRYYSILPRNTAWKPKSYNIR